MDGKMRERTAGKRIRKAVLAILLLLVIGAGAFSGFHHVMLSMEKDALVPPGKLYNIGGHQMHIYAEGPQDQTATIVLLSGSGTAAPVYDFQVLYTKLSSDYRIAVVERSGYGYSEISGAPRDIATVTEESRALLAAAGEKKPYVLMAHSISGLEALYWAQTYPEEVAAIVGLDMSVPQAQIPQVPFTQLLLAAARFLGIQRIPLLYPMEYVDLTSEELRQAQYLTYRNAFNRDVAAEMAQTQASIGAIDLTALSQLPILDFVSNDGQSRAEHEAFARLVHPQVILLDAPHYMHQYESEKIAYETIDTLHALGY